MKREDRLAREAIMKLAEQLGYHCRFFDDNVYVRDNESVFKTTKRIKAEIDLEYAKEASDRFYLLLDYLGLEIVKQPQKLVVQRKGGERK